MVGTARGGGHREHGGIREAVTPTEAIDTVPTDLDDNRVLECAVSAGSQTIVTGDDDLLRLVKFRSIEIVRVADFLTRFSSRVR